MGRLAEKHAHQWAALELLGRQASQPVHPPLKFQVVFWSFVPDLPLPCSWTDPPSRCGRQRKGSKPFHSFASLMPRTGSPCPSIAGEVQPGLTGGWKGVHSLPACTVQGSHVGPAAAWSFFPPLRLQFLFLGLFPGSPETSLIPGFSLFQ